MSTENEVAKVKGQVAAVKTEVTAKVNAVEAETQSWFDKHVWYVIGAIVILIGVCVALALR